MRRSLLALVLLLALPISAAAAQPPARSAIFFYPWYSNPSHDGQYVHWAQGGHAPPFDIASAFFPMRGTYSSGDPHVLRVLRCGTSQTPASTRSSAPGGAAAPRRT